MVEVKVTFIGDAGVGKTSIINRRKYNTFNGEYEIQTIGSSSVTITENVSDQNLDLKLYDTAGQEKYQSLAPFYIKDSYAVVIVYSVNDVNSFESIDRWYKAAMDSLSPGDQYFVLVANKKDLEDKDVTDEQGKNKAEDLKMDFFSVSAKTGDDINSIFESIAENYLSKYNVKVECNTDNNSVDLTKDQQPKTEENSCC